MTTEWKKDGEPVPGYHLVEDQPFARGGAGQVWKATGPGGIRVALKRVQLNSPMGDAELKALELVRSISGHPHLLSIHGFWVRGTELVIAAELASGSLTAQLQRYGAAGIPVDQLLDYTEDAAEGIDFLNSAVHNFDGKTVAVSHRDVKPDNMLLVGGSVKVSDFGLAKALEKQHGSHTGVMTPAYAAPEYLVHQTSSRSDQYSLAASYVELRTGHCIFTGSAAQVMYGHMHKPPDLSGIPEPEARVVARGLAKDPADRFETCRDFVKALRRAIEASGAPAPVQAVAGELPKSPSSPRSATARPDWPDVADTMVKTGQEMPLSPAAHIETLPYGQSTTPDRPAPKTWKGTSRTLKLWAILLPLALAAGLVGWFAFLNTKPELFRVAQTDPEEFPEKAGDQTAPANDNKEEGEAAQPIAQAEASQGPLTDQGQEGGGGETSSIEVHRKQPAENHQGHPSKTETAGSEQAKDQSPDVEATQVMPAKPDRTDRPPARPLTYDPRIHRELPAGLEAAPATGVDPSGWPLEVFSVRDGVEMVFVPGGEFQMGSDERPDEGPVHRVAIRAYYIDRYEVTNAKFRLFVEDAGYRPDARWQSGADGLGLADKGNHPVVWVSWEDADAYAQWAGRQLPTEAQWERAARGEGPGPFPWGDRLPRGRANALGAADGFPSTAPVGSFPEGISPAGCHDLAGNVAEWCRDWHAPYRIAAAADPGGPEHGTQRVLRGGGWEDDDEFLYSTYRMADFPTKRAKWYGFRCVYELPLASP